ncbi:CBS domain-containing protein [Clostridium malenominatum]|uniref:CBS domain-containing protein n=1 Tax=Clostridium malenominatum TaxID=1539 RepID=A0ABN1J3X3_9CLOT
MRIIGSFFLNNVLFKKVEDEFGDVIGVLWDVYVTTEDGLPRVIGYKIKRGREVLNYEFKTICFYEDEKGKVYLRVKGAREIIPRTYTYLLRENLMNKQIVDINGKKLVKVKDLRIAEIAGELKVIAVDTGISAVGRRMGLEGLIIKLCQFINKKYEDTLIMWEDVESLEMINHNLKLSVSYQKLSKLHPADLADILERMDTRYRTMIFENLDEDLAANILEEIEPEMQVDILENISHFKRKEILDNLPNDEIADILDEADEETVEKILLNMEKEDAEEIMHLMKYEEEVVGSLMNTDFIALNINISVSETIELLRDMKPDEEVMYYVYMTDEEEKLIGAISLRDLILSSPEDKLKNLVKDDLIKIKDSQSIDEAVEMALKYHLYSIPVVDNDNKLCGIVVMNDIIEEVIAPSWKRKFKK